jgi:hypothetical protein
MSPLNRKMSPITNGRLAAYATLAGAALAAPAIPSADAAIISSGGLNINIPHTTAGVYLNVVTGVYNISANQVPGWDFNPWGSSSLNFFGANPTASSGYVVDFPGGSSASLVDNLPFGTVIQGAGFTFGTNHGAETTGATAFTLNSPDNLVGFRFQNETAGNQVQYGWLQIHLGATFVGDTLTGIERTIIAYAYEDTGAPIPAGIPEPTTFALLGVMAAGALGVREWRKRKAA